MSLSADIVMNNEKSAESDNKISDNRGNENENEVFGEQTLMTEAPNVLALEEEEENKTESKEAETEEQKSQENQQNQESGDSEENQNENSTNDGNDKEIDQNITQNEEEKTETEENKQENFPIDDEKEKEAIESNEDQEAPVLVNQETSNENDKEIEEGISINDDIRVPEDFVPNAAKRIEVDDLPLLETPANVERTCLRLIEQFKKSKKLPNFDNIKELLQYIQRQKVNSLQQSKYLDAKKYEDLYEEIFAYYNKTEINGTNSRKIQVMEGRIKDVENELERAEEDMDKEVQQQLRYKEEKLQRLDNQQQYDLEQFEAKWNDEEFLHKFEKPSVKLLQLISIERSLVQNGKYEEANEMRQQIEQLEIAESEAAQTKATNEMEMQQSQLLARHDREKETVEIEFNMNIKRTKMLKQQEIDLVSERLNRMRKNLDDYKFKLAKLPPLKSSKKQDTILTPRTQQRMTLCKKAVRSPHISVKPLGKIKKGVKSRQPKSRPPERVSYD